MKCSLWAGEKQGMQTWKEFSPSFKKLRKYERNEGVAGRRRSKDHLWLLMSILSYTLCNRISDYWSTLPDSISSSPLRVEIADWDKLKVPSSSCLKTAFFRVLLSLCYFSAIPLHWEVVIAKWMGGENPVMIWCVIVCDVCLKDLCPD